ncbi:MAG TPA: restriction endonuclease [Luteimonas sp.]|nr:restriction endonuclease [Luteimonas sp.]HRO27428.1 restriction endonuclease [Luteimonas sp.]HRP71281.1 restriction endonuclease [Luteimonas sp.]
MMSNWLIAVGVALLIGGTATFYFRTLQMRRDETQAGIAALSGVSWRTFIHMVLDALGRRGFGRLVDDENAADDSNYVLERGGERWLLACKHGSAFVLGRLTVNELARAIDLKGAAGGFLLTQGRITEDARPVAALQRIELLDGPTLWPQLRDFLPPEQLAGIRAKASQLARQRVLSSWLIALLAGVAVFLALPERTPSAAAAPAIAAVAATPSTSSADAAPTAEAPVAEVAQEAPAPAKVPVGIEQQRTDIAAVVSTLPDVDRAAWSSESTLQVFLSSIDGDAFTRICPLMERYDDLASSRIQLTPPPDSTATVRFRQCRSY